MNRNHILKTLRPTIELPKASHELEQFQNNTLRPILKFQNDFLVVYVNSYLTQDISDEIVIAKQIRQVVINNRSFLVGSIIGMITIEELRFYISNKKEVGKRIISMIISRVIDSRRFDS